MSSAGPTLAVLGGDEFARTRAVQRLGANPDDAAADGLIPTEAGLVQIVTTVKRFSSWPGGPLVWLVADCGPSTFDIAELDRLIDANSDTIESLLILSFVPEGTPDDAMEELGHYIVETMATVVPEFLPAEICLAPADTTHAELIGILESSTE